MKWNNYKGGRSWALDEETGYILVDGDPTDATALVHTRCRLDDGYLWRTIGEPLTAKTFKADYSAALNRAVVMMSWDGAGITTRTASVFAMACIEATRVPRDRSHLDPRSVREEPGYISDEKTPNKVSPGLMQTLISTAQSMNERYDLYPDEVLTREDLFIAQRSLTCGAAYMRYQVERIEGDEVGFEPWDPVLLCAAYNAGSVRPTTSNDWHLLTYGGNARLEKFVAYYNDWVARYG